LEKDFYWINLFACSPRYQEGDITLYALNLYNVTKRLQLPRHLFNKKVDKYLVKPSGPDGLLSKWVIFLVHFQFSFYLLVFIRTESFEREQKKRTATVSSSNSFSLQEVCEYLLIQVYLTWEPIAGYEHNPAVISRDNLCFQITWYIKIHSMHLHYLLWKDISW
jgi:hypothetical protein